MRDFRAWARAVRGHSECGDAVIPCRKKSVGYLRHTVHGIPVEQHTH
jgi:hypothetical protein